MKSDTYGIIGLAVVLIAIFAVVAAFCTSNTGIEPIYHTPEEWAEMGKTPEYHQNEEITGNYDHNLAAKCSNGTFVGLLDSSRNVKVWRGIPFADIPGRFERSVYPADSNKVMQAYYYGKSCMQPRDEVERASQYVQGESDILTLAVYAKNNDMANKSVMVYIHGGGWVFGGTADPSYYGENFVYYNPDVIVVDITYRVGLLGQINLSILDDYKEKEETFNTSTNNGTLDQIQALKWIHNNIAAFGGNPDNVTICGESAGGCAVSNLVMIACTPELPWIQASDGLFNKAISMSGGINQYSLYEDTKLLTVKLMEHFGVKTIKELQDISYSELSEWWSNNAWCVNFCCPDGIVLPKDPYAAYKSNVKDQITILQGATTNEFEYYRTVIGKELSKIGLTFDEYRRCMSHLFLGPSWVYPDFETTQEFRNAYDSYMRALDALGYKTDEEKLCQLMNDKMLGGINYSMANLQMKNGGTTYIYAFGQSYDGKFAYAGAGHGVDVYYLFGIFSGKETYGTKSEVDFSIKFQRSIANFCKTGDPTTSDIKWKAYDEERCCTYLSADMIRLIPHYQEDRYKFEGIMRETNEKYNSIQLWSECTMQAMMEKETGKIHPDGLSFDYEHICFPLCAC